MTNRTKTITAALGGAVALASAAYAIGSQAGDGAATAASSSRSGASGSPAFEMRSVHLRGGARGAGLADLAEDLGVSQDKLRDALEAVREDMAPKGDRRTEHAAALAKALGKSTEDVEKAFETLHDQRRQAFAASLAKSLGLDEAKVRAALERVRPDEDEPRGRHGGPRAMFGDLAEELGVSRTRLRRALRDARPEAGERGRHGMRGAAGADLAKALGVTTEQLEQAFDKLREQHEDEHEARRAAFVAALAKELGISEDKVREALPEGPFGGPGPHGPGRGHR
jgi:biotin operon repressor